MSAVSDGYIKKVRPSLSSRYVQGYIDPSSCRKLFPSLSRERVIYRSSYEKKFIYYLENSPSIRRWGSECLEIPYFSAIDQKMHRYYPDYLVETVGGEVIVVEVKPLSQTHPPVNENDGWGRREWMKNACKWTAAREWCKEKGFKFKILTENTINKLP